MKVTEDRMTIRSNKLRRKVNSVSDNSLSYVSTHGFDSGSSLKNSNSSSSASSSFNSQCSSNCSTDNGSGTSIKHKAELEEITDETLAKVEKELMIAGVNGFSDTSGACNKEFENGLIRGIMGSIESGKVSDIVIEEEENELEVEENSNDDAKKYIDKEFGSGGDEKKNEEEEEDNEEGSPCINTDEEVTKVMEQSMRLRESFAKERSEPAFINTNRLVFDDGAVFGIVSDYTNECSLQLNSINKNLDVSSFQKWLEKGFDNKNRKSKKGNTSIKAKGIGIEALRESIETINSLFRLVVDFIFSLFSLALFGIRFWIVFVLTLKELVFQTSDDFKAIMSRNNKK